jgi:hypothetical protein
MGPVQFCPRWEAGKELNRPLALYGECVEGYRGDDYRMLMPAAWFHAFASFCGRLLLRKILTDWLLAGRKWKILRANMLRPGYEGDIDAVQISPMDKMEYSGSMEVLEGIVTFFRAVNDEGVTIIASSVESTDPMQYYHLGIEVGINTCRLDF